MRHLKRLAFGSQVAAVISFFALGATHLFWGAQWARDGAWWVTLCCYTAGVVLTAAHDFAAAWRSRKEL